MNNETTNKIKYYETFCGHKVSDYALQYGRLDYGTLAKCFDCVLCNNIPQVDPYIFDNIESGDLETFYYDGEEISRDDFDERLEKIEDEISSLSIHDDYAKIEELENEKEKFETLENEIFQYFIVSDNALELLRECNELVFYSDLLGCYIWGVCHFGTSWDYVLTSLSLRRKEME